MLGLYFWIRRASFLLFGIELLRIVERGGFFYIAVG